MQSLYPIRFRPALKETLWGGSTLSRRFGKKAKAGARIGESWEITGMPGASSVVANGFLKGNTLEEIAEVYMDELLGESVYEKYGSEFPLLIKLIDAADRLSIQVHPDDRLAAERHHAWGKTEMWYIIDAKPGAVIYTGFRKKTTKEEYLDYLAGKRLEELINVTAVKAGDVFFIPAGMVHAIGGGVLLAEIQQTSDVTYRIYDWDRVDASGRPREMHTALALDAINFNLDSNNLIRTEPEINKTVFLAESPWFHTSLIMFNRPVIKDYSLTESFVIYICTGSIAVIEWMGHREEIREGETLLIPASAESVAIIPRETATLLEVYVPGRVKMQ
ncbi:MAG TPA: mannose-6-phosphate isomerase [Bacteroidales bacterium]|nr:mannose-6-phosphate isomerase [Bacteroidales bacterium]HPE22194.1 mannose-6-phosphate isomerase [Bacteroidales bacterium]HPJ05878.1 mannose-6-phosphate isomerase [Bacteroidales bacterium]HPQ63089.1 mannose-6-phosphate isomerase [Bacteroidales bacterium]